MIEHIISDEDSVLNGIRLFKLEDEDVEELNGHFYLKRDGCEDEELVKTQIRYLGTNLIDLGKKIVNDSLARRELPDIEIHIYQWDDLFHIEYEAANRVENLVATAVKVISQLIEERNEHI